jgi:transcriptional regulator with XRE-family HTH domain
MTLREVAAAAEISAAHLSDIEKGRSHASLPVLLRIGKSLDLQLAQLLPRLGGHHLQQGSFGESSGEALLSHPDLKLEAISRNLDPGERHHLSVEQGEDVFLFVLQGRCSLDVDGSRYEVSTHDCVDIERAGSIDITAIAFSKLLICRGPRP